MAGEKFTPYALTSLPIAQDRDVNGIYFIRTSTGMKVYAIANDRDKTPVELEVTGSFVDLTTQQIINGFKIFMNGLKIGHIDGYEMLTTTRPLSSKAEGDLLTIRELATSFGTLPVLQYRGFNLSLENLDLNRGAPNPAKEPTLKVPNREGTFALEEYTVSLDTDQEIGGVKTFTQSIALKKGDNMFIPPPNTIMVQANVLGVSPFYEGDVSLTILNTAGTGGIINQIHIRFEKLQGSNREYYLPDEDGELMVKNEFTFSDSITLAANAATTTTAIQTVLSDWDASYYDRFNGENWDIVWTTGSSAQIFLESFKDFHSASNPSRRAQLRLTSAGVVQIIHSPQLREGITIPAGAKLVFW